MVGNGDMVCRCGADGGGCCTECKVARKWGGVGEDGTDGEMMVFEGFCESLQRCRKECQSFDTDDATRLSDVVRVV